MNDILANVVIEDETITCHTVCNSRNVEIYKNPDMSKIGNRIMFGVYEKVRLGIDANGNIYAWAFDLNYDTVEDIIKDVFIVRFEYVKNNKILFLNHAMLSSKIKTMTIILERLKKLFPAINTVERIIKPFDTVYAYEANKC